MQTYMGLVRNPADATLIFEACRQGKLPRIQRRLSDRERNAIRSGSIFVWDEKEAGMRRWTDGKSWSASRVAGSFLTYREMEGKRAVGDTPHSQKGPGHSGEDSDENNDNQKYEMTESYKYKVDGLIKQSFSITTSEDQKLHLISYYGRSHANNGHLRPPAQDPALMHIQIPRGLYPESTLELSIPPGQPNGRPEDHRYITPHGGSGPIAPSPTSAYAHHSGPPYVSPRSGVNSYSENNWDSRNGPPPRQRELRPAIYESQREPPPEHNTTSGRHQYHAPPLPQHQQPPHQTSHHILSHQHEQQHGHHSHTHHFHPYAYPSSNQTNEKPHGNEIYPHPQYQAGPTSGQGFVSQHPLPSPAAVQDHGRPPPPPPPPHGLLEQQQHQQQQQQHQQHQQQQQQHHHQQQQQHQQHQQQQHPPPPPPPPSITHTHDSFRRGSLPRIQNSPRRVSNGPFVSPPSNTGPSKVIPYESAANTAGQHISLPDLHSLPFSDLHERPMARDIPTDRLGRWQEETRVLEVLRAAMKL